jgi:hypothetical protein
MYVELNTRIIHYVRRTLLFYGHLSLLQNGCLVLTSIAFAGKQAVISSGRNPHVIQPWCCEGLRIRQTTSAGICTDDQLAFFIHLCIRQMADEEFIDVSAEF